MNPWIVVGGIVVWLLVLALTLAFFKGARIASGDED